MAVAPRNRVAARADAAVASPPASSRIRALVRTARPRQWLKNVLVFAAPGAAGVLDEPADLARTIVAFIAFCLAASGIYFLNDVLDAGADRHHPVKRNRPVASGALGRGTATVTGIALIVVALGISAPLNSGKLVAVVAGYVALTFAYSAWLKHQAVIDIAAVAAGFVLRAIAGGAATGVALSDWFLIVAGAGSLFIVTGKRYAEHLELGDDSAAHRATLGEYSAAYLGFVRAVAAGVAVTAYCLWAFERADLVGNELWYRLSIVPFVLAVLRYALLIDQGRGGAPEELVLGDRQLQILGAAWIVCFALGVALG
ncbi:MAG: decaprenyl-phosphate phosphoribosyltransferase [Acidimicrobiia bacterium]